MYFKFFSPFKFKYVMLSNILKKFPTSASPILQFSMNIESVLSYEKFCDNFSLYTSTFLKETIPKGYLFTAFMYSVDFYLNSENNASF